MSDTPSAALPPPTESEYFRLLMENVTDYAVFGLNTAGQISAWNTGAERILGYQDAEILGQPVYVIFTPEDRQAGVPQRELQMAREQGRAEDERWHLRKDGERFWASGILTALYDASGRLRGYVKILRDFTERKLTQQRLIQQARLLDLAHDSILVLDLTNRILYWNPASEQIYGYSQEEALSRVAYDLLQTQFPTTWEATRDILLESGQWEGELIHTRKDGQKLIMASRWALERDSAGQPLCFLEINRDITPQKQAQEALLREQAHIETLYERLQMALTESHHRTKNSLQILLAMMEMMQTEHGGSISPEEVTRLQAFVRSMASIHDLLTAQAKDSGEIQSLSSREFIERLVQLLQAAAPPERRIETSIQAVRLSTKQATALALILNELVANALKYSTGDIEVSFEIEASIGHLRVSDSGSGFPQDFHVQLAANTGLELVEMLTRTDLGGQVLYANRKEGGASVTVTLPLPTLL